MGPGPESQWRRDGEKKCCDGSNRKGLPIQGDVPLRMAEPGRHEVGLDRKGDRGGTADQLQFSSDRSDASRSILKDLHGTPRGLVHARRLASTPGRTPGKWRRKKKKRVRLSSLKPHD